MPLERFASHATDVDRAEREMQQIWPTTRLGRDPDHRFAYEQTVLSDASASFIRLHIGTRLERASTRLDDAFMIGRRSGGGYVYRTDGKAGSRSAVMLFHPGSVQADIHDLKIDLVSLSRSEAQRVAAGLVGAESATLRFGGVGARTAKLERYWAALHEHVLREVLADDELASNDLIRGQAVRSLLVAAFAAFPIEILGDAGYADGALPAAVRRAVEYAESHAAEAISVDDLAAAARLTSRGLQAAFRRHLDTTPSEYLRRVRLARAHEELREADPTAGATVRGIARRWGFGNGARFARAYREAYGVAPVATLRG
ncbi:helix-turn-helix domain-containing protein [Agromyces sp. NPDC060279]|uniref:AraC family transcriptional regulator n=1 Tax=Agromyces sp. NPDC060279 TaxID=3347092 RepID=UPI0036541256